MSQSARREFPASLACPAPIMLSIFAVPKSFRGHIGVIQRNAIQTWLALRPACEIILLGSDEGTAEAAIEFGIQHIPGVERNEHGTPLVSSAFAQAQAAASSPRLCYVNADIILLNDFLSAVQAVCKEKDHSLMVGRRWDVAIEKPIDFTQDWEPGLRASVKRDGKAQAHGAIDYFVFPKGLLEEIPPFAVGRPRWDNWVLYHAVSRNIPVVDLSECVMAIHQNHDYSHYPLRDGIWDGEEAKKNLELAGGMAHLYTLLDAQYCLTRKGVRRRVHLYSIYRSLVTLSERYRAMKLLLKLVRGIRQATA